VPNYKYCHSIVPLLEFTFCPPATSAPIEYAFSHDGLLFAASSTD